MRLSLFPIPSPHSHFQICPPANHWSFITVGKLLIFSCLVAFGKHYQEITQWMPLEIHTEISVIGLITTNQHLFLSHMRNWCFSDVLWISAGIWLFKWKRRNISAIRSLFVGCLHPKTIYGLKASSAASHNREHIVVLRNCSYARLLALHRA